MEKFLNKGVQAVITEYPRVGEILDEFGIACTSCTAGSCLLQDVVGIHNLPAEEEVELMYQIEKAIYPERDIKKAAPARSGSKKDEVITYSPPLQQLVDEHKVIKRWLALVPQVLEYYREDPEQVWQWLAAGADFSRYYADKYHHAKEENILFNYADHSLAIIEVMYDEHQTGRNHIAAIYQAVEDKNKDKAARHLLAYRDLLEEHISKEDGILYPWIDRDLTTRQVGELFAKFAAADQQSAEGVPAKYLAFIEEVEEVLNL